VVVPAANPLRNLENSEMLRIGLGLAMGEKA
jgi:hypothetical protein